MSIWQFDLKTPNGDDGQTVANKNNEKAGQYWLEKSFDKSEIAGFGVRKIVTC